MVWSFDKDLFWSVTLGDVEKLNIFITQNARDVDEPYETPQQYKESSNCPGCKLNINVNEKATPLMFAIKGKQLKAVEYLVGQGADVNKARNDGW